MLALARPRRIRPRRKTRHQVGLWTETLEARRLLASTPINLASFSIVASGLPAPGLVSGQGFSTSAQSASTASATVAPASAPSLVVASTVFSATSPSPTLSPLMNDFETAVATSSEVARPTPGTTDRISVILEAPEFGPIPHILVSDPIEVIPGPELQAPPKAAPAPAPAPVQPPAEPAAPVPAIDQAPAPTPELALEASEQPVTFEVWDTTLDQLASDLNSEAPASLTHRAEAVVAAGAMLAAWTGWKFGPRSEGRSRRRPLAIPAIEAGPGH